MAQITKYVDVTKSFFICDPNFLLENLRYTEREDSPEKSPPIIAYEGYNFIPTSYGYRSYFGDNSKLNIDDLPSRCDKLFLYQLANYKNIIIALCEDGIWYTPSTTLEGAIWTHGITLSVPAVGTYKEWTFTIIENVLYVYRQGEPTYWKITSTGFTSIPDPIGISLTINAITPTFLNMAGQIGLFRANASLGFWDSANSTAWSSPLDHADFTPSLTTLAGNTLFSGLLGKIVTVKSQGDNFVIYTTKGIVGVRYINTSTILWEATTITDTAGISSSKAVTTSVTEMEHYAYTNTGIKKIGSYNALTKVHQFEDIVPEVYDLIRENDTSVALDFLNGRFLFISLTNDDYIHGIVSTELNLLPTTKVNILVDGVPYDGLSILPVDLDSRIATDLARGADGSVTVTDGMFIQWSGSGVGSFSSVTTPMHYYSMDSRGNYVPNNNHSGALFDSEGFNADNAPLGAFVVRATPDYPTDYNQLGFIGGTLAQGVAKLGQVNGGLGTYIQAQLEEWNNFISIQNGNLAEIENIPNGPTEYYYGSIEVPGTAQAAIDEAINAFMGSVQDPVRAGNSVHYTVEDVGYFLSGAGTTDSPVITGAGTNHAIYTLKRNFQGAHRVKRKACRTFTSRAGTVPKMTYYSHIGPDPINSTTWTYYGFSRDEVQGKKDGHPIVPMSFIHGPTGWTAYLTNPRYFVSAGDMNTRYTAQYTVYIESGINVGQVYGTYSYYWNYLYTVPGCPGWGESMMVGQIVDWNEYKYVSTEDDLSITDSATMVAYQSNITWMTADHAPNINSEYPLTDPTGQRTIPGISILGGVIPGADFSYTYPGAEFLLQDGVPAPIYPTYQGALVLDTALKKWGKMKAQYTALLDYAAFNSANDNPISYSNLGVDMGILKSDGYIYNMDAKPLDSYIRYGKIGYYRLGMTSLFEVRAQFRIPFVGNITIDTSMNGVSLETSIKKVFNFDNVVNANCFLGNSGKWHSIKISGNYDLHYMEFRGIISGRR